MTFCGIQYAFCGNYVVFRGKKTHSSDVTSYGEAELHTIVYPNLILIFFCLELLRGSKGLENSKRVGNPNFGGIQF
jgi:hypothetical protein